MLLLALLLLLGAFWTAPAAVDLTVRVQALYEAGEYAKAVAEAETAVKPPADVVFYHGLALARLDRNEEAHTVFVTGRKRYPRDKRFPLELAGVAYRRQRFARARRFLRQALQLDPIDQYGNEFLGSLYLVEGDVPAALKYWNRIDKPLIQQVVVTPPPPIRPILRERAIAISPGQIFTQERLRATEANLDRLEVFAVRRIELGPGPGDRFNVTIRLLPVGSSLRGWLGRLLPVARGLPYQTVHFDRTNIANRAINLRTLWRWDANKRRIGWELAGPVHMKPRFGYRLEADARDENWNLAACDRNSPPDARDLKLRTLAFGGDLRFALTGRLEWTTGIQLTRRAFQNIDEAEVFADSWSFEQRNRLSYRLLDLPESRIRVESSVRLRTGRVFTGTAPSRFGIVDQARLYGSSIPAVKEEGTLRRRCRHRRVQYLNNILEQDHRAIKRRVKAKQGFREFHAARRTIEGYEAMHMIRKGQARWVSGSDVRRQIQFINRLFEVAA